MALDLCRTQGWEPPASDQLDRVIRSAPHGYETLQQATIHARLAIGWAGVDGSPIGGYPARRREGREGPDRGPAVHLDPDRSRDEPGHGPEGYGAPDQRGRWRWDDRIIGRRRGRLRRVNTDWQHQKLSIMCEWATTVAGGWTASSRMAGVLPPRRGFPGKAEASGTPFSTAAHAR